MAKTSDWRGEGFPSSVPTPVGAQWELLGQGRNGSCGGRWRSQASASVPTMPSCAHTSTEVHPPGDCPSGCFSNEDRQHPLRIEVVDTKRRVERAFARPTARRRDRYILRLQQLRGSCRFHRRRERILPVAESAAWLEPYPDATMPPTAVSEAAERCDPSREAAILLEVARGLSSWIPEFRRRSSWVSVLE